MGQRTGIIAAMVMWIASVGWGAQATQPAKDSMLGMLNPPIPQDVEITRDVVYKTVDDQKLMMDIYVPASAKNAAAPTVVYVHGGGWQAGSRNNSFGGRRDCVPLMSAGFVVISIDYRLAPKDRFPAQIEDVKAAIRFIRANAQRFHVDPARIGAMGESAGGHLVALLGVAGPDAGFDVGESLDQSSAVQAVVDIYGVHDLVKLKEHKATREIVQRVFDDELLKAGSPVTYISRDAPPFLVIHGDKDTIAPVAQSDLFVEALKKAGAPVEYIRVKNAQHGFWEVQAPIEPSMKEINEAIVTFFRERL